MEELYSKYKRYWPLCAVFLSGLGFSIQSLIIKKLAENGFKNSFQVIWARGFIQCILAVYAISISYSTPPGEARKPLFGPTPYFKIMLFCRSVIGYGGIAFAFLAVERLPMADAICLVMVSPVISSTVAYFALGEPFRVQEQVAIATSMAGMVLVVKPSFIFGSEVSLDGTGVLYGLIAACSAGCAYVFVRILGTTAKMPWENVCFAQSLGQLVLALPFLYMFGQEFKIFPTAFEFCMIGAGATIGAVSQVLMTLGMQQEKSAAAGAMRMSDVFFGFCWQELLTQDRVSFLSVCGAAMIILGVLTIVFTKEKPSQGATGGSGSDSGDLEMGVKLSSQPVYNPVATMDDENIGDDCRGRLGEDEGGGGGGGVEGGMMMTSRDDSLSDDGEEFSLPNGLVPLGDGSIGTGSEYEDEMTDADFANISAIQASIEDVGVGGFMDQGMNAAEQAAETTE